MLGTRQLIRRVAGPGAIGLVLVLTACGGRSGGEVPRLTFVEKYGMSYYLPNASEGLSFSLGVVNRSDRSLEITAVHVEADPELDVTYIGWATCRNGCFGTSSWSKMVAEMAQGRMIPDGKLPVPLAPDGEARGSFAPASLEFRVVLDPARLTDPVPCYHVKRITVDLASGEEKVPIIVLPGGHPVSIQARVATIDDSCFAAGVDR